VKDNDFHMKNIPIEIVSDVHEVYNLLAISHIVKQLNVKFSELTQHQASQLDTFIKKYVVDEKL